jgi:nucleotide-binding universal stress UspA family protein
MQPAARLVIVSAMETAVQRPSYRSIVVGYDGSDGAVDALALGSLLADTVGAELTIVGVFAADPWLGIEDPRFQWLDPEMSRCVADAAQSVTCESACVPSTSASRGLHDFAQKSDADLIVVGSSPRAGMGRVLAGSVSQRLLEGGPCAVAVAPLGFRDSEVALRVIGAGFNGTPESLEALDTAVAIGKAAGATLRLFVVAETAPDTNAVRARYQELLHETLEAVPGELRAAGTLLDGAPAAALLEEADKRVDLLCLGSRGYGPLRRVLLGSVSSEVVQSAPCPVLVVPRRAEEASSTVDELLGGEKSAV